MKNLIDENGILHLGQIKIDTRNAVTVEVPPPVIKYLYMDRGTLGGGWDRVEVIKETDHFYTLSDKTRISKKTMRTGVGWDRLRYHEATEGILESYTRDSINRSFKSYLTDLRECTNTGIQIAVISICNQWKDGLNAQSRR